MKYQILSENLEYLNLNKYDKDFTLIVNSKCYQISRFLIDIISPQIRQLHETDPTLNSFEIKTKSIHF